MPLDDVRVQLDAFEGPLDLLLFLIRRDEVDITDIPISRLTEQYMATLTAVGGPGLEHIDIDTAGEFLVMAATLMEIKSRMLMPPEVRPGETDPGAAIAPEAAPTEDPRADLVRQLLAYKKYRDAAQSLDRRLTDWDSRFPGGGAIVPEAPEDADADAAVELGEIDVVDLAKAFASIMETVDLSRLGEHRVTDDETPIALHATDILDRLARLEEEFRALGQTDEHGQPRLPEIEFKEVFAGRSRAEAIGLFLAVLELVRQRQVEALQDKINGRIVLRRHREPAQA